MKLAIAATTSIYVNMKDFSSRGGDWTSLTRPATAPSTHPHGASHHTLHRAQHSPQRPPPTAPPPPRPVPPPRLPAPAPTAPHTTPPSTPATAPSTHPHGASHHTLHRAQHSPQHPPPRRPVPPHQPPPPQPPAPAPPPPPYHTPHPPPRPAYPPGVVAIFPHRKNSGGRWKNGTRPLCQPGLRLSACQWCNTLTRKSRQAPRPIHVYTQWGKYQKRTYRFKTTRAPWGRITPRRPWGSYIRKSTFPTCLIHYKFVWLERGLMCNSRFREVITAR